MSGVLCSERCGVQVKTGDGGGSNAAIATRGKVLSIHVNATDALPIDKYVVAEAHYKLRSS